jgi:cellulose synthase/poly-beta-1,6-N-acetylglucosamine synthase-like glycosyltransferase
MTVGGGLSLLYVLAGYPLCLALLARLWPRPPRPRAEAPLPPVSFFLSCYNEQRTVEAKLLSLLRQDYPPELLEVCFVDDGSSDDTAAIAARVAASDLAAGRVRIFEPIGNHGKPTQVNRMVPESRGEILIFTDARQPLEPQCARVLASLLSDPGIGGATGNVVYRTAAGEPVLVGGYWRYETRLRVWESAIGSITSAAGPLMCCRRELFWPLPEDLVLDDILMPMRVVLARRRFVYAAEAVAVETFAMNPGHEFRRRVRNSAGVIQAMRADLRQLWPPSNPIWWQYWSHKCGRLLIPVFLAAMALGTLLGLGNSPWFGLVLALQVAGYAYAGVGWLRADRWAPPGAHLAASLLMQALAVIGGAWRELRGGSTAAWGRHESGRRD